ncbi:hypothetical protein IQ246_21420 [aff. Roholtiella sp. LEGE 12411]|nr:hypothetical protein [aff. Roholtiella sp. LEGE 12411]
MPNAQCPMPNAQCPMPNALKGLVLELFWLVPVQGFIRTVAKIFCDRLRRLLIPELVS